MVLEPDVIIRTEVAAYLRDCGYKVIEGVVAGDLWTILDAKVPLSVVLSEIHLPGAIDGFALARRLRQTHPEIDTILTSGVASAAEKSEELCDEGPLKKPYRAADVEARIRQLLKRGGSGKKR